MPHHQSLMNALQGAFDARQPAVRSEALGILRSAFLAGAPAARPDALDYEGAWHSMRLRRQDAMASELQMIRALENGETAEAVCALADLARLPVEAVEHALLGKDAEALLILGRSENFAWSTMRLLLDARRRLRCALAQETGAAMAELEADSLLYDSFPRRLAERALRFIRASVMAGRAV